MKRRDVDHDGPHKAQLFWSLLVALAVAASALFQLSSPKSLYYTESTSTLPTQTVGKYQFEEPRTSAVRVPANQAQQRNR